MFLLTKEQQGSSENTKTFYIYKERFENKYGKDYAGKYRGHPHSICNLKYSVPKKNPIGFL